MKRSLDQPLLSRTIDRQSALQLCTLPLGGCGMWASTLSRKFGSYSRKKLSQTIRGLPIIVLGIIGILKIVDKSSICLFNYMNDCIQSSSEIWFCTRHLLHQCYKKVWPLLLSYQGHQTTPDSERHICLLRWYKPVP